MRYTFTSTVYAKKKPKKETNGFRENLFVMVPSLPLGLQWKAQGLHTVPGSNHWDPAICVSTAQHHKNNKNKLEIEISVCVCDKRESDHLFEIVCHMRLLNNKQIPMTAIVRCLVIIM